jgi:aldose 1-epimerase
MALDEPTPIMLAHHVYWNLGAFVNVNAKYILNHILHMPYSRRIIAIDGNEVPTGPLEIVKDTPYDFLTPKQIGTGISQAKQCGFNCTGYDNAFILDRPRYPGPDSTDLTVLTLSSPDTGIRLDVRTNQQSLQIYSCNNQNGTIPVKASQQHLDTATYVERFGCVSRLFPNQTCVANCPQVVIETQQWIDGINHHEWNQNPYQIYTVDSGAAVVWAKYDFSTVG